MWRLGVGRFEFGQQALERGSAELLALNGELAFFVGHGGIERNGSGGDRPFGICGLQLRQFVGGALYLVEQLHVELERRLSDHVMPIADRLAFLGGKFGEGMSGIELFDVFAVGFNFRIDVNYFGFLGPGGLKIARFGFMNRAVGLRLIMGDERARGIVFLGIPFGLGSVVGFRPDELRRGEQRAHHLSCEGIRGRVESDRLNSPAAI